MHEFRLLRDHHIGSHGWSAVPVFVGPGNTREVPAGNGSSRASCKIRSQNNTNTICGLYCSYKSAYVELIGCDSRVLQGALRMPIPHMIPDFNSEAQRWGGGCLPTIRRSMLLLVPSEERRFSDSGRKGPFLRGQISAVLVLLSGLLQFEVQSARHNIVVAPL